MLASKTFTKTVGNNHGVRTVKYKTIVELQGTSYEIIETGR
jgi:hypothetical protein